MTTADTWETVFLGSLPCCKFLTMSPPGPFSVHAQAILQARLPSAGFARISCHCAGPRGLCPCPDAFSAPLLSQLIIGSRNCRTGSSPQGHLCHHLHFEKGETQGRDGGYSRSPSVAPEQWTPEPGFPPSRQSCFPRAVLPRSPTQAPRGRCV